MRAKSVSEVAQSCPTLSDPVDCGLPGSSIRGIFQARGLEWAPVPSLSSLLPSSILQSPCSVWFVPLRHFTYIYMCSQLVCSTVLCMHVLFYECIYVYAHMDPYMPIVLWFAYVHWTVVLKFTPAAAAAAAAKSLQSCLTLCNLVDSSLLGSSVHGILQTRILEWVAIPFSRGSSQPRDWTQVSCIAGWFFTIWATRYIWYINTHKHLFF